MGEDEGGGPQQEALPSAPRASLGLVCPPNAVLQDALYSILVRGIPVPTASLSTFCLAGESDSSFVHRLFIGEADEILFKIEASADWPRDCRGPSRGPPPSSLAAKEEEDLPPRSSRGAPLASNTGAPLCCPVCFGGKREGEEAPSCLEGGSSKPIQTVPPTQLLIYISYPYCRDVWHAGASELFAHYIAGKPLAPCSVSLLNRALHAFDLLVEIQQVSADPSIRRELALQLSRIRQRLQCGPVQHFLRSLGKRRPGSFRHLQLRRDERIWLSVTSGTVYLIHRFVCADPLRWSLTLKYCQEIAEAATAGPRRLPEDEIQKADFPPGELAVFLVLAPSSYSPAAGAEPLAAAAGALAEAAAAALVPAAAAAAALAAAAAAALAAVAAAASAAAGAAAASAVAAAAAASADASAAAEEA
ncbi:hypothetical protein Efla_006160 [Eimeria flavescens]